MRKTGTKQVANPVFTSMHPIRETYGIVAPDLWHLGSAAGPTTGMQADKLLSWQNN